MPAIPAPVAAAVAAAIVLEVATIAAELSGGCCGGIYSNNHMEEIITPKRLTSVAMEEDAFQ